MKTSQPALEAPKAGRLATEEAHALTSVMAIGGEGIAVPEDLDPIRFHTDRVTTMTSALGDERGRLLLSLDYGVLTQADP